MSERSNGLTYAQAGVDIDAGNALVERIKPLAKSTRRKGADSALGGFGGLFDLKACGFKDPVLVAAHIITAVQSIVSRNVNPLHTGIISVGAFHAGDAPNVIPDQAWVGGTVRTFSREVLQLVESSMRRVAENTAAAFGATIDFPQAQLSPEQRDMMEKLSANLARAALTAQGAIAEAAQGAKLPQRQTPLQAAARASEYAQQQGIAL